MNVEQARFNMIEQQIRPWNVLDAGVLELLAVVKREDFVPVAYRSVAFMDVEIPLGGARRMLVPRVEARLLQEVNAQRHEKVLEIGTGAGFLTAMLGHRAQRVISLESDPALARQAAENLKHAGVLNVSVREAEGSAGCAADAPFDAILLSGSVAEVPAALLTQLKVGGRLVGIVGEEPVMRAVKIVRTSETAYTTTEVFDTVAARLPGFAELSAFAF
jgi:protein-L-isoaspartate(D-aspartate) O-methyltransferase